jgi:hypothetical protein
LTPIANGPFKVTNVGINAVTLKPPKNSKAHPIVNISRVQLYFGPSPELFIEPPKDDAQYEYEVDRIMGQRTGDGVEEYYIHWKGYPVEDDTWEPKTNLSKAALNAWEKQKQREKGKRNEWGIIVLEKRKMREKGENEKKSGDYQLQGFLQLADQQNFDLSHYFPQRGS